MGLPVIIKKTPSGGSGVSLDLNKIDLQVDCENRMRLYLINPFNPLVSLTNLKESRWTRYRVWKPLGLLTVAGLTPSGWDITIIDENLGVRDYSALRNRTWWESPPLHLNPTGPMR